jgi:hypothetical protein
MLNVVPLSLLSVTFTEGFLEIFIAVKVALPVALACIHFSGVAAATTIMYLLPKLNACCVFPILSELRFAIVMVLALRGLAQCRVLAVEVTDAIPEVGRPSTALVEPWVLRGNRTVVVNMKAGAHAAARPIREALFGA